MRKALLSLFIISISISTSAQEFNKPKLDSLFDVLDRNNKSMGSFTIAKEGKIVYQRSIGISNLKNNTPYRSNNKTLYRIGSITKMYTAAMIFQLIDEGALSLDTKLAKYYPQIPNAEKITIELLLNHRNGLFDFVNDGDLDWIREPHTKQELLVKITNNLPHFAPGVKEEYSNSGYLLLAYILEDVTKQSYNNNLQQRICSRLGLKNTYSPADNSLKFNEAASFRFLGDWQVIKDIYFTNTVGVGDILTTPTELIVFNEALISGRLFSANSLKDMTTFNSQVFGKGIMKVPFYSKTGYGHGGGTNGTYSLVVTYPEEKITIAYSVNGEIYPHNDIAIAMLSAAYGKKYKLPEFTTIEISSDVLDMYTGTYFTSELPEKLIITRVNKMLIAQGEGQIAFPLEAVSVSTFKYDHGGLLIQFEPAKKQIILKQNGNTYTMTKE